MAGVQRWPAKLSAGLPLALAMPLPLAQAVRVERRRQLTQQMAILERRGAHSLLLLCSMLMAVAAAKTAMAVERREGAAAELADLDHVEPVAIRRKRRI